LIDSSNIGYPDKSQVEGVDEIQLDQILAVVQEIRYPVELGTINTYSIDISRMVKYSLDKKYGENVADDDVFVTYEEIVDDLFNRDDLEVSSKNTYGSALLYALLDQVDKEGVPEAIIYLRVQMSNGKVEPRKRPKGPISLPKADLDMLVNYLDAKAKRKDSLWHKHVKVMLLATLATGIRPIEWLSAKWTGDDKVAVQVLTAKSHASTAPFDRNKKASKYPEMSSSKQLPQTRDIPVNDPSDRLMIDSHMKIISEFVSSGEMVFKDFHKHYVQVMTRACKDLWLGQKKYSIYSGRKQFSANKKAEVGIIVTATLMGHSRPDSPSASSYGNAKQAYFKPVKIRQRNIERDDEANTEDERERPRG
jgi:hypothetical protein